MSHRCLREEKNGEWETRRNGTPTGYANGRWGGAEGWGMNLMCAWVQGAWVGYLDGWIAPDRRNGVGEPVHCATRASHLLSRVSVLTPTELRAS